MKATKDCVGSKPCKMTKREAKLLVHIARNFPNGICEDVLAESLGWRLDDVHEALETCAMFGLVEPPPEVELPGFACDTCRAAIPRLNALLTPEEQQEAEGRHFH